MCWQDEVNHNESQHNYNYLSLLEVTSKQSRDHKLDFDFSVVEQFLGTFLIHLFVSSSDVPRVPMMNLSDPPESENIPEKLNSVSVIRGWFLFFPSLWKDMIRFLLCVGTASPEQVIIKSDSYPHHRRPGRAGTPESDSPVITELSGGRLWCSQERLFPWASSLFGVELQASRGPNAPTVYNIYHNYSRSQSEPALFRSQRRIQAWSQTQHGGRETSDTKPPFSDSDLTSA